MCMVHARWSVCVYVYGPCPVVYVRLCTWSMRGVLCASMYVHPCAVVYVRLCLCLCWHVIKLRNCVLVGISRPFPLPFRAWAASTACIVFLLQPLTSLTILKFHPTQKFHPSTLLNKMFMMKTTSTMVRPCVLRTAKGKGCAPKGEGKGCEPKGKGKGCELKGKGKGIGKGKPPLCADFHCNGRGTQNVNGLGYCAICWR